MKICTGCKENKAIEDFGKAKFGKDGLRAICKECHNKGSRKWQKDNNEKIKERKREQKAENPIVVAAKRAVQTARRKEKHAIYAKSWRLANPGKVNAKTAKRRARKLQATPKWNTKEDYKKMEEFYIEAARLTKETGIPHEVDHIEPLQGEDVCGLHVPGNLRVIQRSPNRRKSNKRI